MSEWSDDRCVGMFFKIQAAFVLSIGSPSFEFTMATNIGFTTVSVEMNSPVRYVFQICWPSDVEDETFIP